MVTTAGAGAYSFTNLRPGTYTITETQPIDYLDGADTIGTPGGVTNNDFFSAVVLGGMGNVVGVGIGAFVIYLIQSIFLKQLNILFGQLSIPLLKDIDFLQFQYVLYGAALVIMMLRRPQGIFPARRRHRSFAESAGDSK